jgi:transcriptional regulator with XRE-family HTH domain
LLLLARWVSVVGMDAPAVSRIGDYIKEQRETASLSLRRLAQEAGVSNPYLSQVERGLRKPSAEILQQLAKALRISAEQLYVQAGLLEDKGDSLALESAVLSDPLINERQKRVLLDIYASFLAENAVAPTSSAKQSRTSKASETSKTSKTKKATATKSAPKKRAAATRSTSRTIRTATPKPQ